MMSLESDLESLPNADLKCKNRNKNSRGSCLLMLDIVSFLGGLCVLATGDVDVVEPKGSLSKPRRRRQRERNQTKGVMRKPIAVHVRYKCLYISLP